MYLYVLFISINALYFGILEEYYKCFEFNLYYIHKLCMFYVCTLFIYVYTMFVFLPDYVTVKREFVFNMFHHSS